MQLSTKVSLFCRFAPPRWGFGKLGKLFLLALLTSFPQFAQIASRYALILEDKPVAERFESRAEMRSQAALALRQDLKTSQQTLRAELQKRSLRVTGSASTLLNAVFVEAPDNRVPELKTLPGVVGVVRLRRYQAKLNQATQILNSTAA